MVLEEVGVFGASPPQLDWTLNFWKFCTNQIEQKDDGNSDYNRYNRFGEYAFSLMFAGSKSSFKLQYSQIIVNLKSIDFKVNCDQSMTKHCTLWVYTKQAQCWSAPQASNITLTHHSTAKCVCYNDCTTSVFSVKTPSLKLSGLIHFTGSFTTPSFLPCRK